MVDLEDVAEAAATVLCEAGHAYAIYELSGPEILDQTRVAAVLSAQLGQPVRAEAQNRGEWREKMLAGGADPLAVAVLLRMFEYYEQHGFYGNSTVLAALLRRSPVTLAAATARHIKQRQEDV
jgi:hypothetical protein